MKKILMAVPTKERSEMVEEVLRYELPTYIRYNIDICYYDSSRDDRTKDVIGTINREYGTDICYKTESPDLCLDYKIIEMFKDFQKMDYDYYWMINDSISMSEELLEYIMSIIDESYDLIRLPLSGSGNTEDCTTCDVNDWFHKCSQGMAHMASTIMSKSLLEENIDWDGLREKYVYNNTLDDRHGYFFTVGFYLERIARLDSFKGLLIGNRCKWRRDSPLKKNQIYWSRHVFETWAKSYPETILKLPEVYTDKEYVIRASDNITPGRFSKEMLIHYRLNGLYDKDVYAKYKDYFRYVTTETDDLCRQIAEIPLDELKRDYPNLLSLEDAWEDKLDVIEELVADKQLYLYGAGLYGEKVIKKLKDDGYADRIKGVVVSTKKNNVKQLCNVDVYGIDDVPITEDTYFILCALPGTASGMKDELLRRNIPQYIGLFDV